MAAVWVAAGRPPPEKLPGVVVVDSVAELGAPGGFLA